METLQNGHIQVEDALEAIKLSLRLKKFLAAFGLKQQQFCVLLMLRTAPDGINSGVNPKQIAKVLDVLPAGVTRIMKPLESAQLIQRQIGKNDRREMPAYLTDKGSALLKKIQEQISQF